MGVDAGDLTTGTAAALVGAGMLSVLLFPFFGVALHRRSTDAAGRRPDEVLTSADG